MRKKDFRSRFGGAALVSGASAGIGEAFAHALAARGMDLVLVARRQDRLHALAAELAAAHGIRAFAVAGDLGERDGPRRVRDAVDELDIPIGLLVNNAGFGTHGELAAQDAEREAAMVDLNCRAPVLMTHLFLPDMLARGRGGIIFTASMAAFQPTPYLAVYGATKAFDLMLAEALWEELRGTGVDVLALCPGFTPTEFQDVADVKASVLPAASTTREEVVEGALRAIGRQPSVVPGALNKAMNLSVRFGTRSTVARVTGLITRPRGGG